MSVVKQSRRSAREAVLQALYAIEINRGWFEKNNVKIGDKVLDI